MGVINLKLKFLDLQEVWVNGEKRKVACKHSSLIIFTWKRSPRPAIFGNLTPAMTDPSWLPTMVWSDPWTLLSSVTANVTYEKQ